MKAEAGQPSNECPALTPSGVRVLIVYEDLATGNRAMRVRDSLVHHCGRDVPFQHDMWKFDTLRSASIRNLAAQDACHADVVMVSAHGSEELPNEVKTWFSQWFESRSPRPTALVALLDHAVGLLSQFDPAHAYLEQMAKQAGMQFVSMFIEQEETEMPIHQARSDLEDPPPQLEAFCRKVAQAWKGAPQPETQDCLTPAPTPP